MVSDDSDLLIIEEPVENPPANLIQEETGPHYLDSNWQCGECGEVFSVETYLKDHMDSVHIEEN